MGENNMQIKVDAEKFATTVISSYHAEGNSYEEIAKKQLSLYLTSYLLAENFNNIESQYFEKLDFENMEESDYDDFMLKLSALRAFR